MQKATVKHLINIIMFALIADYFFFTSTQKQENERGPIFVVDTLLLAVVPCDGSVKERQLLEKELHH